MRTSAAVNYAYLYVGLLEVKWLLPNYKNNLLFTRDSLTMESVFGLNPGKPLAWTSFL
jgi:hypothetical protein